MHCMCSLQLRRCRVSAFAANHYSDMSSLLVGRSQLFLQHHLSGNSAARGYVVRKSLAGKAETARDEQRKQIIMIRHFPPVAKSTASVVLTLTAVLNPCLSSILIIRVHVYEMIIDIEINSKVGQLAQ